MDFNEILELIHSANEFNYEDTVVQARGLVEELQGIGIMRLDNIPELIQIGIIAYCNGDKKAMSEEIMQFVTEFNSCRSEKIIDLKLAIDWLVGDDYCPYCGSEIKYNTYNEGREYAGMECSETMVEKYCRNGCRLD